MSNAAFAGRTAIVGIATSDFNALYKNADPERTAEELATHAIRDALADAGIEKKEVDGLITGWHEPAASHLAITIKHPITGPDRTMGNRTFGHEVIKCFFEAGGEHRVVDIKIIFQKF